MRRLFLLLLPVLALCDQATADDGLALADQPSVLKTDPIEFQLNFNRDAPKGIDAAAQVSQQVIQRQPTFGLHDSTGIQMSSYFAILMLDTTDPTFSKLHFLQGDFQANDRVKADLASQSKPLVTYHAPGTLGEPSGPRKYTFLLYDQNEGAGLEYDASASLLDGFDQELFESDNGLGSAIAGLAISVNIDDDYSGGSSGGDNLPPYYPPTHTSPNQSITTTKTIGDGDSSGPTRITTSKRSIPSVWTISGEVISGYTPDAIPFTTPTDNFSGIIGGGGKAMITAAPSTAGSAPVAGLSRRGNSDGLGTLALMATMVGTMAVAIVLM